MSKILIDEATVKLVLKALEAGEYYIDDLEAIVYAADDLGTHEDRAKMQAAITALREALAEQSAPKVVDCHVTGVCVQSGLWAEQPAQQEPVVVHQFRSPYCSDWYDGVPDHHDGHGPYEVRTLYTTPQAQCTWVGLTDDDIKSEDWVLSAVKEYEAYTLQEQLVIEGVAKFAYAIEAKLKEKNT